MHLDSTQLKIEIASLQNNNIDYTTCEIGNTFEYLLSLEGPSFSIVSKLVDIYHRQLHDVPDYDIHRFRHYV